MHRFKQPSGPSEVMAQRVNPRKHLTILTELLLAILLAVKTVSSLAIGKASEVSATTTRE
jgi:hypothetical protein